MIFPFLFFKKFLFYLFIFLQPHLWHMEVPRVGVKSEVQLRPMWQLAAMPDPCPNRRGQGERPGIEPASSQRQCWVLNPLSHNGNSLFSFLILVIRVFFFLTSLAKDLSTLLIFWNNELLVSMIFFYYFYVLNFIGFHSHLYYILPFVCFGFCFFFAF